MIKIRFYFAQTGILDSGKEDFESSDEIFEAIGELLQALSADKTQDHIMYNNLCIVTVI